MEVEWAVAPLDTLFFRGAEPFSAGESVFLQSLFPPTPRTIQGMVRTALLEAHCVDIPLFSKNGCEHCAVYADCTVKGLVGSPKRIGTLRLRGPHILVHRAESAVRLHAGPGDLRIDRDNATVFRLDPGLPQQCDEGNVCLPQRHDGAFDFGWPVDWVTEDGLQTYLEGGLPRCDQLVTTAALLDGEPRVGLAIDRQTRAASEGMLYSVEPIRLRTGVRLGERIEADGVEDLRLLRAVSGLHRLGGEGRLVDITECTAQPLAVPGPAVRAAVSRTGRLRLVLLQAGQFSHGWLPEAFMAHEVPGQAFWSRDLSFLSTDRTARAAVGEHDVTVWRGQLAGVGMTIYASCGGPPASIGGWNVASQVATAVRLSVAAGTVYYCELEQPFELDQVLSALHDTKVGLDTEIGFGHVVVGAWL